MQLSKEQNELVGMYRDLLGEKEQEFTLMKVGFQVVVGNILAKLGVQVVEGVQVKIDTDGTVTFTKDGKDWLPTK